MWWDKPSNTPKAKRDTKPFPFMKLRWVGFIVTLLIFVATTWSLATRGLNYGLDFTGGVLITAKSNEVYSEDKVRGQLAELGFEESVVQTSDGGKTLLVRLPVESSGGDFDSVLAKVKPALGATIEAPSSTGVSAKVSGELFTSGVIACLLAVVVIAVYVWFRFESKFGIAAFVTTFHDVYAIAGLFSIFQLPFDLTIVAGLLTIAGYSINDTVVVFDRIREMLKKYKKMPIREVIDVSITATLSRTIITSICTLLAAVAMLVLGGPVLWGLALSICFGIIVGTYSSIFVAAPMLLYLPGRIPGTKYREADTDGAKEAASGA